MLYIATIALALATQPEVEVHPERQAQIDSVAKAGAKWVAKAHPRFASFRPGASMSLLGVKGDWAQDIREHIAKGLVTPFVPQNANMVIPESFDSATFWPQCSKSIGMIRDQSNCGCCWAFGGSEAASDRMCIATNASMLFPLSDQDICFNANYNGCGGGQISTPWTYISSKGVVTGGLYKNSEGQDTGFKGMCSDFSLPHCHHHGPTKNDPWPAEGTPGCPSEHSPQGPTTCDPTASPAHSSFAADKITFAGRPVSASGEQAIQQMIMEAGPVETAFTVYSDFEDYDSGIYHHVSGSMAGGHAVKFVGWGVENGVKYWKVQNSWNPFWGEKGYFRIVRGNNEGGIESSVMGSPTGAQWGKKSEMDAANTKMVEA